MRCTENRIIITAGIQQSLEYLSLIHIYPDPDNNTDTVTTDVTASADLSVVKTASPESAAPGQYLTYTIAVSNAGPSAASDVLLSDTVPADLTEMCIRDRS